MGGPHRLLIHRNFHLTDKAHNHRSRSIITLLFLAFFVESLEEATFITLQTIRRPAGNIDTNIGWIGKKAVDNNHVLPGFLGGIIGIRRPAGNTDTHIGWIGKKAVTGLLQKYSSFYVTG